jgi:chromosomal replication initiation ATPase DnaA
VGKKEGHRQTYHHGGKDGRVLADARFLEQVLEKRIHTTPKVSLDEIMTYVSAEYGVKEEELREPSLNRVVCEARAVIGWLSWRLESSSITDVAIYFQRESSTFSRHMGKIDAKAKSSDKLRDRLNGYINTQTHACPHIYISENCVLTPILLLRRR